MQAERALAIAVLATAGSGVLAAAGCGDHKAGPADASADVVRLDGAALDAVIDAAIDATPDAPIDAFDAPPQIVHTAPVDGTLDAPLDATIDIDFSEPIAPATVTGSSLVVAVGGTPIAGTLTVSGARVTFTPAALAIGTQYTVTATTAITDLAGTALASSTTWSFHTVRTRRVFTTSVYGYGDLSTWPDAAGQMGLAAGDAICQARATAAGLPGTFVAWLSTSTNDAYCRVQKLPGTRANNCGQATLPARGGPWLRVDGEPWAGTLAQLATATPRIYSPQLLNELGQVAWDNYFSNSTPAGVAGTDSCSNWSASTGGMTYGGGRMSGVYWTSWGPKGCYQQSTLLCLEVGNGLPITFPPVTGKRAFLTSTTTTGRLYLSPEAGGQTGVAAGDAICQARAAAASLPNANRFKAWLSTSTTSAASRITSDGPWQRVDGFPLASSKLDLLDGMLARSLNVTESGSYLTGGLVWTATYRDGSTLGAACGDWTGSTATAYVGRANDPRKWSYAEYNSTCTSTAAHLYCLED